MDPTTIAAMKQHIAEWSGGFPPESLEQITFYIDYTLSTALASEDARRVLVARMGEAAMHGMVEPHR